MADTKEMKTPVEETVAVVVTAVPIVNDSSEGLARMYEDLAPYAAKLRSSALTLLFTSLLLCGTLEGFFGIIAAMGILCCAAPGSLGAAYSARCTRILATFAASCALVHLLFIGTFAFTVLPAVPAEVGRVCHQQEPCASKACSAEDPPPMQVFALAAHFRTVAFAADADAADAPSSTFAPAVALTASHGGRMLEAALVAAPPVPTADYCARVSQFFEDVVPAGLAFVAFLEAFLFLAALSTAKAAASITRAARRFGANAM